MFDVLDVRKNLFLFVLVQFTHQVYGVVRIHIIHKPLGDCFGRKHIEKFLTGVLIHFDEYVGGGFVIE